MAYQKTACFDFDATINSYKSGWKGIDVIPDPPVEGIKEVIDEVRANGIRVVVHSTRCSDPKGIAAIYKYLTKYGIVVDEVSKDKPLSYVNVDDRGLTFDGNTKGLAEKIINFKNWIEKDK